jgi:hypothetical protein
MQHIEIEKINIPYGFDIVLEGKTYTFLINYNAEYDYFTVDLYSNGTLIVAGEKIVYGRVLFSSCFHLAVPQVAILPYDVAEKETKVSWENLNETVFLWLVIADG